jgi:predicted transcriptional regulator
MNLQAVKTSFDKRTKSLQETAAVPRKDLHEELRLMLQAEIRISYDRMEAKTDATQHKFQTHLREIETRDKCE